MAFHSPTPTVRDPAARRASSARVRPRRAGLYGVPAEPGGRDELRVGKMRFVFLKGDYALLLERLRRRHGHFADEKILASQLATLEEPGKDEQGDTIAVQIGRSPDEIVAEILAALKAKR